MNREEIRTKLQEIFCDIFDNDDLYITDEMAAKDIEEWDSLNNIRLIGAIESNFDIHFEFDEINKMKNVGDIIKAVEGKLS